MKQSLAIEVNTSYGQRGATRVVINLNHHEQRRSALRVVDTVFQPDDPGPFIRDAFDALFDKFERLEHFIRIELIRFEDVEPPLRYYVRKLATSEERPVANAFLNEYEFEQAKRFLDRFDSWKQEAPPNKRVDRTRR